MATTSESRASQMEENPREDGTGFEEEVEEGFETEDCSSHDSEGDPTFDIIEETRSRLSKISLKKSRPREGKKLVMESDNEEEAEAVEIEVPQLDEKDGKCFEKVERMIKDGQLGKLKVDQCKVYLRKYGLRLTGNKDVLVGRIREHLEVIDGGGEMKYPISCFVVNCKGDACTGDVVMFEQNVYETYSIASRSATGPPCGTRIVAGRIVKESYGAAKQQHTFTIEVLWSKGKKPLPPLHPLLIKGRNLYRLKTMRQRWADEEERMKVVQEKHTRGHVARCTREVRIKQKETRKMNQNRSSMPQMRNPLQPNPIEQGIPKPQRIQSQYQHPQSTIQSQNHPIASEKRHITEERQISIPQLPETNNSVCSQVMKADFYNVPQVLKQHSATARSNVLPKHQHSYDHNQLESKEVSIERQSFRDLNSPHSPRNGFHDRQPERKLNSPPYSSRAGFLDWQPGRNFNPPSSPRNGFHGRKAQSNLSSPPYPPRVGFLDRQPQRNFNPPCSPRNGFHERQPEGNLNSSVLGPPSTYMQRQPCRYYRQGRCYYRENCKFLHD